MKNFTKRLFILLAVLACTLNSIAERFAFEYAGQTVYYERTENYTARVDYCPPTTSGGVAIPAEVTYQGSVWGPVTAVAPNAFEDCIYITAVSLPASVKSIGGNAFKNCTSLTSVVLTATNEQIAISLSAFDGCSDEVFNSYDNALYLGTGTNPYLYLMKAASTDITSCKIHSDCKYINDGAFKGCDKLTAISLPNTITYIGMSAFNGCSALASITINSGVTTIGKYAFDGCSSLTTVTVPRSVTNIGFSAFRGCSALESITLPFVGNAAKADDYEELPIYGCTEYVQHLFGYIFGTTSYEGGTAIEHVVVWSKDKRTYYIPSSLTTVTIDADPNGVDILEGAFSNCTGLTSVTLKQVTSIGKRAFQDCASLTSVTIPRGATSITRAAFYGCTALESITLPFPGVQKYTPAMVETELAEKDLPDCDFLFGSIFQYDGRNEIPSSLRTVNITNCEYLPYYTFYGCNMLTSVTLPNNLTNIDEKAFYNCSALNSINIPNNVTTVGENAYEGCTSIASITTGCTADLSATKLTFSKDGFNYRVLNKSTVEVTGSSNTTGTVTIPATVTCGNTFTVISIAEYAFGSGFSNVNLISVPETVSTIGYHAFTNVPLLQYSGTAEGSPWGAKIRFSVIDGDFAYFDAEKTKLVAYFGTGGDVVVPNTVTEIYETAFRGNTTITSITLPANVTSIDNNAFYGCTALTSITIPESVTSIGDYAFSGCSNVQEFVFEGETPPTFGSSVFGGSTCPIYVPTIDAVTAYETADNMNSYASRVAIKPTFVVVDGVKYQLQNDGTFAVIANNYSGDIVIRNSVDFNDVATAVTLITANAFKNCTDLTAVTIPSGITSIGNYAFGNCTGLTSVTIPGSVTSIGIYAFSDCGLNSVTILEGVTSIGTRAFYECTGLKSVTIPESVTSIGHEVFYYCRNVQEFVFEGETPPTFGSGVFNTTGNCPIYVPTADAVTAYKAAENMTDYASRVQIMPIEVDGIRYQIQGDGTLAVVANNYSGDVVIRSSVDYNGVATAVTSIAANAFKNCTDLTAVTVPSSITSIGSDAFKSCTNLTKVIINSNAIASQTYTYNSNLVSIFGSQVKEYVLGEDVTEIGTYAFRECNNVISVIIPEGITSIGASAFSFSYSSKLREFIFEGETPPTFGTSVFAGSSCPIYVPNETALAAYKEAENMNKYASRVQVRPIEVDGIRYQIQEDGTFAVVANNYSGDVVIPSSIDYNGVATAVTSIAAEAFENCTDLTAVTIPSSITSIGTNAFSGCGMTKVTLNSNAIASKTYTSSSNLKGVFGYQVKEYILGEEVTSIGNYAFYDCSYTLDFVFERETPPAFGTNVFYNTSCPIYVPNETAVDAYKAAENMSSYASRVQVRPIEVDGIRYQIQEDGTLAVAAGYYLGEVVIPESVEYDGVATAVTSIAANAFKNCTGLTSVSIPESITSIGSDAFKNCTSLTTVTIPEGVTTIGSSAFSGCTSLTKVTINSNTIASNTYTSSSNFKTIFGSQVTEYVLGENVTAIGSYAFYGCTGLTSVAIPENVTEIGSYAFLGCTGLTSVAIPENVTKIRVYAFSGCIGLTSVTIPENVTEIGENAFRECTGLTSVTINSNADFSDASLCFIKDGIKYKVLDKNSVSVVANSYSGEVVIPESVTFGNTFNVISIADNAFYNCKGLTAVSLPASVKSIGYYAFKNCTGLTSVITNSNADFSNASLCFIKDGFKYQVLDKNSVSVVANSYSGEVAIPESVTFGNTFNVTSIADDAFKNCTGLTSVTIPESITSIGSNAFYGCKGLTTVTIPEGVTTIRYSAFSGCTSLTKVTINSNAFISKTYTYNSNLKNIFGTQVTEYVLGENVTAIGSYAFYECTGLTTVIIPENITEIGSYAFSGCTGFTSVTFPENITEIGSYVFYGCTGLTTITIPENITTIANGAFKGCTGLTSVTIPKNVTSIGNSAFSGCTNLTKVTINSNAVATMEFEGYSSMKNIFGTQVTEYILGEDVTEIGYRAFFNCTSLTSMTIPESVTSIGGSAFYGCKNVQEFIFESETPPTFGGSVFEGSTCSIYVPTTDAVSAYRSATNIRYSYENRVQVLPIYTITVVANNDEYGMVSGGGTYDVRETPTITISATAVEPYFFAYWKEDGNTEASRTITLTGNATYTAVFKRLITVSNITVANKVYDGTTTATIMYDLAGVAENADVTIEATADFADENVGEDKAVTYSFAKSGEDADNYELSVESIELKANISAKSITISEIVAENKVYDGNPTATGTFTTVGIVENDNVSVEYTAAFADANVGEEKEVTFSFSLSGDDKDNYILASETAMVKANISAYTSAVVVTITENSATETYDGTEKTVTGYEVEINTELYKETDFTFNGTAEAKGTNAGEYEMNIAASDFENTNTNFADVTFTVVDGKLTIEKSSETPNMPELTAETRLLNITDVVLPEGWAWADETIALVEGENQAVANYVGDDAGNYTVESVTITITRLPCLHDGEYTIVDAKEATCTADGYTGDHKCSICGAIFEQGSVIPAEGHKAGEPVVENYVAPTCTEAGTVDTVVYCTIDNEEISRKTSVLPATGHIAGEAVVENYVAPTCTEAGTVDTVYYCTIDGDLISRETYVLEAKGHQPGKKVAENLVPATITSEGSVDSVTYCTVCGEELSREHFVLPILDHEHIAGAPVEENRVEPTCTVDGSVDTVVYCTVNGEELSREHYVLPALGHLLSEPVAENYVAPTCTEAGSVDTVVYCTRDNEEISRETYELPALGHKPSEKVAKNYVAPTCTEAGSVDSVVTCTVCGEILSEEHFVLPALGHTAGEAVVENYTAPTCTEAGTVDTVYYCAIDGELISKETYELPATGHKPSEKVAINYVPATTTTEGSVDSVITCTVCGEVLYSEHFVLPILDHEHIAGAPVEENRVEPTCTVDGSVDTVVYCTVNGEELSREQYVLPALGHKPSEKIAKNYVAPTCTEAGSVDSVVTCTVCGEVLSDEHYELPAIGHIAGEAVVENYVAPTCTTTGTVDTVYYCTIDGDLISRETYELPALGHKAGEKVAENYVAPTKTEDGSVDSVVYCTICGEELSRESFVLPAIGHDHIFGEPVAENYKAPTCTEAGSVDTVVYCLVDGEELSRETYVLPMLEHVAGEKVAENYVAPTATEEGSVDSVVYCTICGEELSRESYVLPIETTAISDVTADAPSIYAFGHTIVVETTAFIGSDIVVYDINGRIIATASATNERTEINVSRVGVYGVRIANVSATVMIR